MKIHIKVHNYTKVFLFKIIVFLSARKGKKERKKGKAVFILFLIKYNGVSYTRWRPPQ